MSDIAFTESVKAVQSRRGSRAAYAKFDAKGRPWQGLIRLAQELNRIHAHRSLAGNRRVGIA